MLTNGDGVGHQDAKVVRVIAIGDHAVGKTSLIMRYLGHSFHDGVGPTISANCQEKKAFDANRNPVVLQIWDTAGQEQYQSVTRFFYRNAQAALICCARTDGDTLKHIVKWAACVAEESPECKKFIVITKCDLTEGEDIDVLCETARKIAEEIDAVGPFRTSAVSKEGIDDLFENVINELTNVEAECDLRILPADEKENRCC